jgi:hypothetical protein
MGIMVGGSKTITIQSAIFITYGNSPIARFGMAFWQELEDLLGPILGPIVRGIFEPVYRTFENTTFRTQFLFTVIWTSIIIAGLVFTVYEAPSFFSWILGTQYSQPRVQTASQLSQTGTQHLAARQHQRTRSAVEEERERKRAVVEASGVKVQSILKRMKKELILEVIVKNGSSNQIDMVVVDIDLPADINTSISSFRMQRLGTIGIGQTEVAEFKLQDRGGDVSKIGGHVEFLGASYEVSKLTLPPPEIKE